MRDSLLSEEMLINIHRKDIVATRLEGVNKFLNFWAFEEQEDSDLGRQVRKLKYKMLYDIARFERGDNEY
jgi:hypothetical protein